MNIDALNTPPHETEAPLLIAGLFEDEKPADGGLARLDTTLGNQIERALTHGDFSGKKGEKLVLYAGTAGGPRRLVLLGLGDRSKITSERIRRAYGEGGRLARQHRLDTVAVVPPLKGFSRDEEVRWTQAALEGVGLAMYRYVRQSRELEKRPVLESLTAVSAEPEGQEGLREGARLAAITIPAVTYARDLVATPGLDLYPQAYADQAIRLEKGDVKVRVLDAEELAELGMGAVLAVGQGSSHPPVLIHLTYEPEELPEDARTLALIGKGVTFDAGGLDLKPAAGMRDMKIDMAGSAAVMGVFHALNEWKPACRVEGFIAAAENLTGSNAYRPGDVITSYKGLTIEIDNTDAEGRLTMADALAYAVEQARPDAIIDLATLTGACMIALGHHATGMMGTDEAMCELLNRIGEETGERVWRLPLYEEYTEQISSEIADLMNTGGRPGGASTAAAFLKEFVDDVPWTHLDIAGTAKDAPLSYVPKKALPTGVGVRLLLHMLKEWA